MNGNIMRFQDVKLEKRNEYSIEYVSELFETYKTMTNLDTASFVSGIGHRKSIIQSQYQEMQGYFERLKKYAKQIELCGKERNSYSKTDHSATFMRLKRV